MSQNLMSQLAKYEGYCCVYGFFFAQEGRSNKDIAEWLGVTPNTIRMWRKRIDRGEISCGHGATGHNGCIFRSDKRFQNTP